MVTLPSGATPPIAALASACANRLPATPSTFTTDHADFQAAFGTLLAAVAASHPRYAFDPEGRPQAVRAVRSALPAMEAELFDAILEDVACELAAMQEALYQVAVAKSRTVDSE